MPKGIKGFQKGNQLGKLHKGQPFTFKHKENLIKALRGKKHPWVSEANKKRKALYRKNHWNWKGGISSEDKKVRQTLEYEIWRQEVYKKDNWTCRLCGKKCKKDIIAHHLKLFSGFSELRFSVDNGITLCRSCHKKIHKDIGLETRFKKH